MASVHLEFFPPDREGLTKLHIYESADPEIAGTKIETVTAIGTWPDYIHEYTTDDAVSVSNWFRIQWEDDKGATSDISVAVQGNTETLVGKIVDRVQERDPHLSVQVIRQEAEAVIQAYYGDGTDPYDVSLNPSYRILNGLVLWVLARTSLATYVSSSTNNVQSATIGLVTLRSGSGSSVATKTGDLKWLFEMAFNTLGIGGSIILQIQDVCKVYGGPSWMSICEEVQGQVIEP